MENRKVKYIVVVTKVLGETENFEDVLNKEKQENRFHYVVNPFGEIIPLKQSELNHKVDAEYLGEECLHLLFVHKSTRVFHLILWGLCYLLNTNKKINEILRRYQVEQSINEEQYQEKLEAKIKLIILENVLKIQETEKTILYLEELMNFKINYN